MSETFTGPRRLVPDARQHFAALQEAAERYPERLKDHGGEVYLRRKPFDDRMGHPDFFGGMFAVMNALHTMRLPAGSLVVEVGSGPGWLTEMLLALGHGVVAVEPSPAMHEAATKRIALLGERLGGVALPPYLQVTATLEDWDMTEFQGAADAVMFHEAFHHVIDEAETASRSFALLQPGGVLSITGDSRWQPGNTEQERFFREESERYGTLESPFTREYLRALLERAGFSPVTFYHAVNGWFPLGQEHRTVGAAADPNAEDVNNVLAYRPGGVGAPFLRDPSGGAIDFVVVETRCEPERVVVTAWVYNIGSVALPCRAEQRRGGITFALLQDDGHEPADRFPMPATLPLGGSMRIDMMFAIASPALRYRLRAVAENVCWLPGEVVIQP